MINSLVYLVLFSFVLPVYNVGDTITDADQNIILNVCDQTSEYNVCLLYTSPSPRDRTRSRMPSSA